METWPDLEALSTAGDFVVLGRVLDVGVGVRGLALVHTHPREAGQLQHWFFLRKSIMRSKT